MPHTEKIRIYQELHIRLVYMDIALELATQLTSAMHETIDDTVFNALETVSRALNAYTCRIIVFSEREKMVDFMYPRLDIKPFYESLLGYDEGGRVDVMADLSKRGYISVQLQDIARSEADLLRLKAQNILIVPISQKSIFDYSGFMEVAFEEKTINSADIEFLKIVGIVMLGSIKRVEAEKQVGVERDALSSAIKMTTKLLCETAKVGTTRLRAIP